MSKIHEALAKIQRAGESRRRPQSVEHGEPGTRKIARLVDAGAESDDWSSDNNRVLHLDQEALRDAGLIAPEYHERLLANQYRDIKRPLIAHAFGRRATQVERGNLIMVTSSVAGEGKTFTSMNLAMSMAQERDYSVLLVDADVAKPHISEMFGVENEIGLLDLLENSELDVRSAILPTDQAGLNVLPAGKPRSNASELLASEAMDTLVEQFGSTASHQLVVFDSPPILQTSEAKVLARSLGQIVMVVRADHTSRDAVGAALSTLGDESVVNLLLNQARYASGRYEYGYSYGVHASGHEERVGEEAERQSEIFP